MDKILFSLPVHERPDVVRDQIENINYFCPGSVICIHVAAGASASREDFARQCGFDNVIVNPYSYEVVPSGGLMHAHVSNFLHVVEEGIDFDKIVLISAEELLVKHGLSEYVSKYSIGAQTEVFDLATDWGVFREDFLKSARMQGFLEGIELPLYFGGQAEGQFLSKKIFSQLARLFIANFPMGTCGFPVEEVVLPTVAARYCITGTDIVFPITLCNYCSKLVISEKVIAQVRSGKGTLFARRVETALRSPHIGVSVLKGVFSVKLGGYRNDELRQHVRGLMT